VKGDVMNSSSNTTRRTKIVATVGAQRAANDTKPTTELGNYEEGLIPHGRLIERFIDAGADVIRLNMAFAGLDEENGMSYGYTQQQYLAWLTANRFDKADQIALLADLAGPKIRLGSVSLGSRSELRRNDLFYLSFGESPVQEPGATVLVNEHPFLQVVRGIDGAPDFAGFVSRSEEEVVLSVAEGKLELRVEYTENGDVAVCRVTNDFVSVNEVVPRKGLTIKRATLDVKAFQEADQRALDFLLEHGSELLAYVAVSFAQTEHDILEVRHYLENHPVIQARVEDHRRNNNQPTARVMSPGIIAKIETPEGWKNIDEILDIADGIMVARGDLGEQAPADEVPEIQKDLIRKCNARGKIVITATQMLDSMETKPNPTRAEAADVFNAILDGTDAVMLSGETSSGCYPIKAIRTMSKIALRAERYYFMPGHRRSLEHLVHASTELLESAADRLDTKERQVSEQSRYGPEEVRKYLSWLASLYAEKAKRIEKQPTTDRISEAACLLSEAPKSPRRTSLSEDKPREEGSQKTIVVPTTSGRTAMMISRFKVPGRIIGAAHYESTFRKLLFGFGIRPVRIGAEQENDQDPIKDAVRAALEAKFLQPGEEFVATAGTPLFIPGTTNLIQLLRANANVSKWVKAADSDRDEARK